MNNIHIIFGAPGCGKTFRLMEILSDLLKKYRPEEIAFVSFTRKGSYEGRDRALRQFNYSEKDFPYFRTLHSIAFRELKKSKYDIISRRHYREFSRAMGMNFLGYYTEDLVNNDDKYLFQVSLQKNNPVTFQNFASVLNLNKFYNVRNNYIKFKNHSHISDFDDLLQDFITRDEGLPVRVAIIDEAQDLTTLQWDFCKIAFKDCEEIYIAGDDDQAIYEWSGADVPQFLALSEKAISAEILSHSYRLKKEIVDFSQQFVNNIKIRVAKDIEPSKGIGNIYFYNHLEDLQLNNEESYYFLSRNNCFLKDYKELLAKFGMTYYHKNEYSINFSHYNAIKKYENFRKNEQIEEINKDPLLQNILRKDAKPGAVWYEAFDLDPAEAGYLRNIFKNKVDVDEKKCRMMINTIHGVKGGEADNVVLRLDITKNVHEALKKKEFSDAEMRVLYVACTRAKKNLHIIYSKSKFGYSI